MVDGQVSRSREENEWLSRMGWSGKVEGACMMDCWTARDGEVIVLWLRI